eukprot:GHVS01007186.1.p1 GENE.GHVS01007186.1~~GHVS01007186.1.p1  ORF type:complete len:1097 (+),score=253.66 GHVS01007186.1:566-3856(+)
MPDHNTTTSHMILSTPAHHGVILSCPLIPSSTSAMSTPGTHGSSDNPLGGQLLSVVDMPPSTISSPPHSASPPPVLRSISTPCELPVTPASVTTSPATAAVSVGGAPTGSSGTRRRGSTAGSSSSSSSPAGGIDDTDGGNHRKDSSDGVVGVSADSNSGDYDDKCSGACSPDLTTAGPSHGMLHAVAAAAATSTCSRAHCGTRVSDSGAGGIDTIGGSGCSGDNICRGDGSGGVACDSKRKDVALTKTTLTRSMSHIENPRPSRSRDPPTTVEQQQDIIMVNGNNRKDTKKCTENGSNGVRGCMANCEGEQYSECVTTSIPDSVGGPDATPQTAPGSDTDDSPNTIMKVAWSDGTSGVTDGKENEKEKGEEKDEEEDGKEEENREGTETMDNDGTQKMEEDNKETVDTEEVSAEAADNIEEEDTASISVSTSSMGCTGEVEENNVDGNVCHNSIVAEETANESCNNNTACQIPSIGSTTTGHDITHTSGAEGKELSSVHSSTTKLMSTASSKLACSPLASRPLQKVHKRNILRQLGSTLDINACPEWPPIKRNTVVHLHTWQVKSYSYTENGPTLLKSVKTKKQNTTTSSKSRLSKRKPPPSTPSSASPTTPEGEGVDGEGREEGSERGGEASDNNTVVTEGGSVVGLRGDGGEKDEGLSAEQTKNEKDAEIGVDVNVTTCRRSPSSRSGQTEMCPPLSPPIVSSLRVQSSVSNGRSLFKGPAWLSQLATMFDGVETRRSTLGRTAGLGLFTTRFFAKNSVVTEFVGWTIDRHDALLLRQKRKASHIVKSFGFQEYICGISEVQPFIGGGSFANDGSGDLGGPGNNTKWYDYFDSGQGKHRKFLKATKDICEGEEVFVCYHKNYWKDVGEEDGRCRLPANCTRIIKAIEGPSKKESADIPSAAGGGGGGATTGGKMAAKWAVNTKAKTKKGANNKSTKRRSIAARLSSGTIVGGGSSSKKKRKTTNAGNEEEKGNKRRRSGERGAATDCYDTDGGASSSSSNSTMVVVIQKDTPKFEEEKDCVDWPIDSESAAMQPVRFSWSDSEAPCEEEPVKDAGVNGKEKNGKQEDKTVGMKRRTAKTKEHGVGVASDFCMLY